MTAIGHNNAPRVIQAEYSDWRPVKGRKVLQLVFEVPLEQQQDVLTMLGAPMPDRHLWCVIGVAPDEILAPPAEQWAPETRTVDPAKSTRARQAYATKNEMEQASARAGILCRDPLFQAHMGAPDTHACIDRIHEMLGGSRKRIADDEETFNLFIQIETDFKASVPGGMAERRG